MNFKTCLQLNEEYKFHNICTIHPISLIYTLSFETEQEFLSLFTPYMLSYDIFDDNAKNISLFRFVLSEETLIKKLLETLKIICKTNDIQFNIDTLEIFIDGNSESLNEGNFDEFSDLVLEMIQSQKLKNEKKVEPHFETEDGRRRWLMLQEGRERERKRAKSRQLYDVINIIQFGMGSYIPDDEIKKWTYWKLIKSYLTITQKENYNNCFDVYVQCGDKKLVEKHWSQLCEL